VPVACNPTCHRYLWRTGGDQVPEPDSELEKGPDDVALGVQFNTCIDAFTRHNGGTLFKLGSHRLNIGPPRQWNELPGAEEIFPGGRSLAGGGAVGRAMTPYGGADAQTIECPAGSVILYDARTWHRMGENRSGAPRSCIPLATIPSFVMPFFDKAPVRPPQSEHVDAALDSYVLIRCPSTLKQRVSDTDNNAGV
jgi:ectoine hydroxylase-related dioxygenase (phytanoyl-CoA dioxygenase family)